MKWTVGGAAMLTALVIVSTPVLAGFQASDLIYLPVAAHNEGEGGTQWNTDLYITNTDETAIDISMFYLPSGGGSNAFRISRQAGAGGREEEGWGSLDPDLADIPPNGTLLVEDVLKKYWDDESGVFTALGAIVIFAYEAGTLDSADGSVPRNAVVNSRTYNLDTVWIPDGEDPPNFVEQTATYGQTVQGVPWYNQADPEAINELGDFTFEVLNGAFETEDYRYNAGVLNSSDLQTSIQLLLQPFQPDGTPYLDEEGNELGRIVSLPPLAHIQYNRILVSVFGLTDVTSAMIKVSFVAWSSTSPEPIPYFTAYGSLVDGRSNDPTTIHGTFAYPYNVECMWPGPSEPPPKGARPLPSRRPLSIPPR